LPCDPRAIVVVVFVRPNATNLNRQQLYMSDIKPGVGRYLATIFFKFAVDGGANVRTKTTNRVIIGIRIGIERDNGNRGAEVNENKLGCNNCLEKRNTRSR